MRRHPLLQCEAVRHAYRDTEGADIVALAGVDLRVRRGEAVALVGPSGVGKSTLLTLVAGLIRPTGGRIWVGEQEVTFSSERQLLRLRASAIGMVLQTPARNLIPYATARQNLSFASRSAGLDRAARRVAAEDLAGHVGLGDHLDRPARLLSGGQQQRLAVAMALTGGRSLVLADEPTSQLDRASAEAVIELLLDARERQGMALVVVTHDLAVTERFDTTYRLDEGTLTRGDTR